MKKILYGIGLFLVCIGINSSVMASDLPYHTGDVQLQASALQAVSVTRVAHNFQGWCLNESGSAGDVYLQLRQGNDSDSLLLQSVVAAPGLTRETAVWGRADIPISGYIKLIPCYIPWIGNPGCSAIGTLYYDGL